MTATLQAKIQPPQLPSVVIAARQQRADFVRAQAAGLVLVCAPAGYGKTTWVRAYCANQTRMICWYSLDEPDDDPRVFGPYLVSCFAQQFRLSAELMQRAQDGHYQQTQELLGALLVELEAQPQPACLVLDDVHHLQHPALVSALAFLVRYLPASIQTVLASRLEPQALSRQYLQKNGLRIGRNELCWDDASIIALFDAHGHRLTPELAGQLNVQIEGWVTGLKLVALNHQAGADCSAIGRHLPGRDIEHYLFYEIYSRQPPELRQFLRRTAVVERFNRALAEHLLGEPGQVEFWLQQLERQQFFLTSLGEARDWFRYHPLLSAFLCAQLEIDEARQLQVRAANWWEQAGQLAIAARHYALSRDSEPIFGFLLREGSNLFNRAHTQALAACLDVLPARIIAGSLQLTALCAWFEHVIQRRPERVTPLLAAAEQSIRAALPREQAEIEIVAHFGSVQSSVWLEAGETERAVPLAERTYAQYLRLPDSIFPAPLFSALSDIAVQRGELAQAGQYSVQAAEFDRTHQMFLGVFWHLHQQAVIAWHSGDFGEAEQLLAHAMHLISQHRLGFIPRHDSWLRSKARLCRQRLQHQEALHWLELALAHNEAWPHEQILNQVELAQTLLAQQDWSRLQPLAAELESAWFNRSHWPRMQAALEQVLVQLWSLRQDQSMLKRYLRVRLTPVQYRSPEAQLTAQTQAWAQLALGEPAAALHSLTTAVATARQHSLWLAYHQGCLLQAAAYWQLAEPEQAQALLADSLDWVQSQQALMTVLTLGHWLEAPLAALAGSHPLAARSLQLWRKRQNPLSRRQQPDIPESVRVLGLTRQEWRILQRLTDGLSNDELCDRLHLSMNTIRSHIRRINKKIGANTRTEAVQIGLSLQQRDAATAAQFST